MTPTFDSPVTIIYRWQVIISSAPIGGDGDVQSIFPQLSLLKWYRWRLHPPPSVQPLPDSFPREHSIPQILRKLIPAVCATTNRHTERGHSSTCWLFPRYKLARFNEGK